MHIRTLEVKNNDIVKYYSVINLITCALCYEFKDEAYQNVRGEIYIKKIRSLIIISFCLSSS